MPKVQPPFRVFMGIPQPCESRSSVSPGCLAMSSAFGCSLF